MGYEKVGEDGDKQIRRCDFRTVVEGYQLDHV